MTQKSGLFNRAKSRLLAGKFASACLRETGSIESATAMMQDVNRVQDHLVSVLAYSSPELTGKDLIKTINEAIFSNNDTPLALPDLFRRQAERIHHAERTQYNYVAGAEAKAMTIEKLRGSGLEGLNDEDKLETMAEALVNLSLSIGDNCRNLGDKLNMLAATLDRLPQTIQNMALRPHLEQIKANDLVPQELKL